MTNHVSVEEIIEKVLTTISNHQPLESNTEESDNIHCSHFFKYLVEYPMKDTIPEECLICSKLVDCIKP